MIPPFPWPRIILIPIPIRAYQWEGALFCSKPKHEKATAIPKHPQAPAPKHHTISQAVATPSRSCTSSSISPPAPVSAQLPQRPLFPLIRNGPPITISPFAVPCGCNGCSTLIASFVASTRTSKNIFVASSLLVFWGGRRSWKSTDLFAAVDFWDWEGES